MQVRPSTLVLLENGYHILGNSARQSACQSCLCVPFRSLPGRFPRLTMPILQYFDSIHDRPCDGQRLSSHTRTLRTIAARRANLVHSPRLDAGEGASVIEPAMLVGKSVPIARFINSASSSMSIASSLPATFTLGRQNRGLQAS